MPRGVCTNSPAYPIAETAAAALGINDAKNKSVQTLICNIPDENVAGIMIRITSLTSGR